MKTGEENSTSAKFPKSYNNNNLDSYRGQLYGKNARGIEWVERAVHAACLAFLMKETMD